MANRDFVPVLHTFNVILSFKDSAAEARSDRLSASQQSKQPGEDTTLKLPTTTVASLSTGGLLQLQNSLEQSAYHHSSPAAFPDMSTLSAVTPQKIFNPEAYCELCNKEFCNKYFLKTHKANKHGIYSDEFSFLPGSGSNRSPPTMVPSTQHNAYAGLIKSHFAASLMSEDCHTAETFHSDTDAAMTALRQLSGAQLQRKTSTSDTAKTDTMSLKRQESQEVSDQPENLSVRASLNKSTVSDMQSSKKSPSFGAGDNQILLDRTISHPNVPSSLPKPPVSMGGPATPKPTFPDLYCPLCHQTFANSYVLQSHMLAMHSGNFNPAAAMNLQAFYASMMGMGPSPFGPTGGPLMQAGMLAERMKMMAAASHPQAAAMMGLMPPLQIPDGLHRPLMPPHSVSMPTTTSSSGSPPVVYKGLIVTGSSSQTANTKPEGSMGVSNKEAFCEICRKEFCNKYFLRTHKQNKHGIVDETMSYRTFTNRSNENGAEREINGICDISPPGVTGNGQSDRPINADGSYADSGIDNDGDDSMVNVDDMSNEQTENRPTVINGPTHTMSDLNGAKQDLKRSYSDTDALDRTPPMKLPKREVKTPQMTSIAELSENSLISAQLNQFPRSDSMSSVDRSRISCPKCPRTFTSVFAVVSHSFQEHGEPMDPTGLFARASLGLLPSQSDQFHPDSVKQELMETQPEGTVGTSPDAYCEICKKEFCSKYFLRTHKLNIHGINTDVSPNSLCPPMGTSLTLANTTTSAATTAVVSQQAPMPLAVSNSPTTTSIMNVTPSSRPFATGKNFCDVCNKELCNKYFLRTHMLKMHGVVVDENKMVIGSVSANERGTGGTGYPCDICHKELSSRHFLKIHRQNAHGVRDETLAKGALRTGQSPANKGDDKGDSALKPSDFGGDRDNRYFSHYTEVCPLCDRRFKSAKWLRTHMWTEHKAIPEMFPGSALKLKLLSQAKSDPPPDSVQSLLESVLNVEFSSVMAANTTTNNNTSANESTEESGGPTNGAVSEKSQNGSEADSFSPDTSCDFCGEAFRTFADLQSHVAQQHSKRDAQAEQSNATLAVSNKDLLPASKPFVMQPFYVQEENPKGVIVPSMIYLPVGEDIREPMNISIHISPVKYHRDREGIVVPNGRSTSASPSLANHKAN